MASANLQILSLATADPPLSIPQSRAAELATAYLRLTPAQKRLLPVLFRRSRVEQRGSVVLDAGNGAGVEQSFYPPADGDDDCGPSTVQRMQRYALEAFPLSVRAARRALDQSGLPAESITHVITVSCTGFAAPGVDIALIKELKLRPTVSRTHVGFMGCHGAVNALRVAAAFAGADPAARILLCAVELCSLHFQYGWDSETIVANSLFADGAAALVAAPAGRDESSWSVKATGSCLLPDSAEAMSWRIGDHGFQMTLSSAVPDLIAAHLRPWLVRWLAEQGLELGQIRSWAIHPGGPRILSAVSECLELSPEATAVSDDVLARHGNMSSPTLLYIVDRLRAQQAPRPCLALGFGPGMVAEAALLV